MAFGRRRYIFPLFSTTFSFSFFLFFWAIFLCYFFLFSFARHHPSSRVKRRCCSLSQRRQLLPLFLACLYIQRIKRWSNKTTTTKDNEQEGEGESRDKERKRETSLNQTFPIKHGRLYIYILMMLKNRGEILLIYFSLCTSSSSSPFLRFSSSRFIILRRPGHTHTQSQHRRGRRGFFFFLLRCLVDYLLVRVGCWLLSPRPDHYVSFIIDFPNLIPPSSLFLRRLSFFSYFLF